MARAWSIFPWEPLFTPKISWSARGNYGLFFAALWNFSHFRPDGASEVAAAALAARVASADAMALRGESLKQFKAALMGGL